MRIICQQTIIIKCHALLVIFEKAAKFEIAVYCMQIINGALWVNSLPASDFLLHLLINFAYSQYPDRT